jgi:hypothetical protein
VFSNELGTKFTRRSDTFESSQRMGQAMRVEQIPLKAPEAVPGALRISETAQRFAPAADFRPRKPAGFVSEGVCTFFCMFRVMPFFAASVQ